MNRGFSLIEMLIVGVIIGVLVTLAFPEYRKAVEKSRVAEAITMLGNIMKGEQVHYLDTGEFTSNLRELLIDVPGMAQGDEAVSSVDTSYYTVAMVDNGARATAHRKGNANMGPSVTFVIEPSTGEIKRYCNDSSSTIKLCEGLRQGAEWESAEYTEPEQEPQEGPCKDGGWPDECGWCGNEKNACLWGYHRVGCFCEPDDELF